MAKTVITAGGFDALDSKKIRFIHEGSKSGELNVLLFGDEFIKSITGQKPRFNLAERTYFVESVRYVSSVYPVDTVEQLGQVSKTLGKPANLWLTLDIESACNYAKYAKDQGIDYKVITADDLTGFPEHDYDFDITSGKKIVVSGCYDWFHTGHVRFFEEASEHGDLYVILGHDKNLLALKGPGHPMFPEDERKYLAGSIKFVKQAIVATGDGWLDAEPEIDMIKPDGYLVNEDGHKDVKAKFCEEHGIEYIVLKREPKPGLTRRTSTDLRGF